MKTIKLLRNVTAWNFPKISRKINSCDLYQMYFALEAKTSLTPNEFAVPLRGHHEASSPNLGPFP